MVFQSLVVQISDTLHGMNLVRFNVEFNFDLGRTISFVCQDKEYSALCEKLADCFETFEQEQFQERSERDGKFPDERLYRRLTSERFTIQRVEHTRRQSDRSITIMISREVDDGNSWKFEVVDSCGEKHLVLHRRPGFHAPVNWRPGEYDAYRLFHFIGMKYAFRR